MLSLRSSPLLARTLVVALASFAAARPASADSYPRNPNVDILRYTFALSLTDVTDAIEGEAAITVRFLTAGLTELTLDFVGSRSDDRGMTVDAVADNGSAVAFEHRGDRLHMHLTEPSLAGEHRELTIRYHGVPIDGLVISHNKFGNRTFFADNFPDRARYWLPTVDHPSDKAACDFIVTAPDRYEVIANGIKLEETNRPDGRRVTHWRQSVPIATYLMVVGVAQFAVQYVEQIRGVSVETWVFPQDRDAGFHDFARAGRVLEFFASRIGPYPYEKLANVQSRTRYAGMENASAIFYGEDAVTGRRHIEDTMVHEIAHQWFGDSVTESDWNHVWLSEGFATYLTHLFNEFTYGRDRAAADLARDRQTVIAYARRQPDARVVDPRVPIDRILDPYAYEKGGWVLHMLRRQVGDEAFWAGIREYYRRYRDGTALTDDFERVVEEASGQELGRFFRQWIYEPAYPHLKGTWRYESARKTLVVQLEQIQPSATPFGATLDIGIRMKPGELPRIETVTLAARHHTFTFRLDAPPVAVTLDPNTWLLMEGELRPAADARIRGGPQRGLHRGHGTPAVRPKDREPQAAD